MRGAQIERGLTQLLHPLTTNLLFVRAMNDECERIYRFVVQQEGHLHHIALLVSGILITAGDCELALRQAAECNRVTDSKLAKPELRLLSLS